MGCFSFICKNCNTAINSDSFHGEDCKLFLLKNGKVIQEMEGEYDSYGRCFIENDGSPIIDSNRNLHLRNSFQWNTIELGTQDPWNEVCELIFNNDTSNGIAAYHTKCYKNHKPRIRSEGDPDQGWNKIRQKFRKRRD